MNRLSSLGLPLISRILATGAMLVALSTSAMGSSINFGTDPFEGTTARNTPGRQVVGGELFISFHTATEGFVFDGPAFGLSELRFANGPIGSIASDANVVVLQTTDNDNDPLTPFVAGNAADLLANRITTPGPGLFIYFNSSLNLPRLVYSDDLSSNSADLKILARMLNLNGQSGQASINELPDFTASNFALADQAAVPEPSSLWTMSAGIALLSLASIRRHSRISYRGRPVALGTLARPGANP